MTADDASREIEHLRARNKKLAEDKSYYQLILRLIERLDPLPGVDNMLRTMLLNIVECVGGTNIRIYYWVDRQLHYQDFHGANRCLEAIDDPDVEQVFRTRAMVEQQGSAADALLKDGMLRASWTWTFPLSVGPELVGIVKLENLHIHGAALGRYLPIFFSHAALILANELRNEAHRRSERALQAATERLELATEAGLIGIWDWDIERDELVWDRSMYTLYGLEVGAFGGAYQAWISAVHPEDKAYADAEINAALRGEREYGPEFRVVWPDGSIHHLKAASRTLRDDRGKALRMVGINYDLTERIRAQEAQKRLNRELRAIGRCNEALLRATDEQALLERVTRIVCEEAGYRMAWVGFACDDSAQTVRPMAWAGAEQGFLETAHITWADTERGRGPTGTALRTGETSWLDDFGAEPRGAPWRSAALSRGYRSSLALPLKDGEGHTFGALCIYSAEAAVFVSDERRLLEELAADLAFGITVVRARSKLERAEADRLAHLRFLESMDRVNRAMVAAEDLEGMMGEVLDAVLGIFECDRAFLVYPCDPEAATWSAPMEKNRPQYPGVLAQHLDLVVGPEVAQTFRTLLAADHPVKFGPATANPIPPDVTERFLVRSFMSMAIHPKLGKPWQFGVHQCSHPREWTREEERLLEEIGRRLGDALTTFLVVRDLQESEQKLSRAEGIVHVGYIDRDLVGGKVSLSDETSRILGLDPLERTHELGAWERLWESRIHPDDRPRVLDAFTAAIERSAHYDVEYRVVRPGGEVRFVHSQADVTRDEGGVARRVLGTMSDITGRVKAEAEIRELNQKLEQRVAERTAELAAANRELEAFAYSVSHDLRVPLRAVDGYRGLLQRRLEGRLDEEGRRYLGSISEAAQRMGQLIDDLLSFSRMGRVEMAKLEVDLGAMVADVIRELEPDAALRSIDWRVGRLPVVQGDRAMLRLVLVNLLTNALKFTGPRARAEIEIASRLESDGAITVFVRDNGVGFDMAHVEKLFGVFQRLHGAAEFEGTGIGLANVRRVITRHGGRTWAEGELGRGATFFFSLPPRLSPVPQRATLLPQEA
jgi:PAS domain S-box-containing protein